MKVVSLTELNQIRDNAMSNLIHFIDQAIQRNKDQIAYTIDNRGINESPKTIIHTYVDYILSHGFKQYDKDELISLISSGVIFSCRKQFIDGLMDEAVIQQTIQDTVSNDLHLLFT
jgi:hypothetical protein